MATHLRDHAEVWAHDRAAIGDFDGVVPVDLDRAAQADVIVLAVPVQSFDGVLEGLRPHLEERARAGRGLPLVVDVASVKVRAVERMVRGLPDAASIIATHPLFGPESGRDGIAGLPIAYCPVRASEERVASLRGFLAETLRLRVIETTPDEHDRQMAYVQGLTHLISRAVGEMELPQTPMATAAYRRFLDMRANLAKDSWDLFVTIERENPYAAAVRRELRATLESLEARLDAAG